MFEKEDFEKYMKDSEDYYDNREPMTERKLYQLWKDGAEFGYNKANEWHYVKDELPKIKVGNKIDVEVCFLNAFDNSCKKSCYWNGKDFLYWSDKNPIGEKKVSLFGKIYAWKYADNFFPKPPKEIE